MHIKCIFYFQYANLNINRSQLINVFLCSMLFGNLFVYYQFMGKDIIDKHTRMVVFVVLTVVGVIGVGVMCLLPKPGSEGGGRTDDLGGPSNALKKSFALFKTRDMLLLAATFFYTGV